jgi:hypothetical protein
VTGEPLAEAAGETEPHCVAEQDTDQFTPPFDASFTTVAVNCCVPAASIVGAVEVTETEIPAIDVGTEADADGFATDVAVTVTVKPPGGTDAGTV